MKLQIAAALALTLASAAPAFAQHPTQPPAAKNTPQTDSTITALVGTWEGSVYSDHGGDMALKLTFAKSPALGVAMSIVGNGQDFVDAAPTNLKVEGTSAMWTVGLMQTACKGTAVLIAGTLKGGFDCGGMSVTYIAAKKK